MDQPEARISIKKLAHILWISGLLSYFAFEIMHFALPKLISTQQNEIRYFLLEVGLKALKMLASVSLTTGIISLVMQITSIKNLIIDTIEDRYNKLVTTVLNGEFIFDNYSQSTLKKIQKRLLAARAGRHSLSVEKIENSVYCLEDTLCRLVTYKYYQYHELSVQTIPREDGRTFLKKFRTKYCLINPNWKSDNGDPRKKIISFVNSELFRGDEEKKKQLTIHSVTVNGRDETAKAASSLCVEEIPKKVKYNKFDYQIKFNVPLEKTEVNKVELEFEYFVDSVDPVRTFRLKYPCKKLRHEEILSGPEVSMWAISANVLSFNYLPSSSGKDDYPQTQTAPSSATIIFDDWIPPGCGYVVVLNRTKK